MTKPARLLALVSLLVALAPVQAGENDVYVRIVQVKATGKRDESKHEKAEMDKALEPLRAHLEPTKHAKYTLLGKGGIVKKGAWDKALAFDLENHLGADATPSQAAEKKIKLVLKVNKHDEKNKKDELVFETTIEMKDAATAVQQIEKGLEGGDLLLAVTASRDSL